MAENTKIEWAHHTFNPWIGCTKVSPGCDHCYAEADFDKRRHIVQWGAGQTRKRTAPSTWSMPIKWNTEAERLGIRYRVFCASLADVFDNEVPREWRDDLATLILATPHLDWLLLTKRIGNAADMLVEMFLDGPPPNIRIGASITSQPEADRDIPKLVRLGLPNFLSMEPLLGPVDLQRSWLDGMYQGDKFADSAGNARHRIEYRNALHWVIVGGESGHQARPMHPDWARSLRDQCRRAGVAFLFKQWGEWATTAESPVHPEATRIPGNLCRVTRDGISADHYVAISTNGGRKRYELTRVGKKAAGRHLDGRTWDEVPE